MKWFLVSFIGLFSFLTMTIHATEVKLTGTLANAKVNQIELQNEQYYVGNSEKSQIIPVIKGKFEHTFELSHPGMILIKVGNQSLPLFINPGDHVDLYLNADDLLSLSQIRGDSEKENRYLLDFQSTFATDFDAEKMKSILIRTSYDEIEMMLYESRKLQNEHFQKRMKNEDFSEGFKTYLHHQIEYNYWRFLAGAPIEKANANKSLVVSPLPKILAVSFQKARVNNMSALPNEPYREFMDYYITYTASSQNDFNKFTDFTLSAEKKFQAAEKHLTGNTLAYYYANHLYKNCENINSVTVNFYFKKLKSLDKSRYYTSLVEKKCSEKMNEKPMKKSKVAATKKATSKPAKITHDFSMTGLDGKQLTLDDLKGKVVYIDFWASWCGPCRQQFPFAKELKKKFDKKQLKQLAFLYISIDKNETIWKNAIEKFGLEGVHGLSPGGWGSDACKYFKVNSIPRYMLMDKNGKIVDSNAKRPSNAQILSDILKLMNQ